MNKLFSAEFCVIGSGWETLAYLLLLLTDEITIYNASRSAELVTGSKEVELPISSSILSERSS